jgi:chromosome segregation ATPase
MSGDELDRTIEFLLQNAARSDARFDALQLQLRELGDHVTVMTQTLTTTLTAMNERDARQDKRLANLDSRFNRVESQIEQLARLVHAHVSDPHAHGPQAG